MKTKVPSYSFFRILIVSLILYFLLITPTTSYLVVKNFPDFFGKGPGSLVQKDTTQLTNNPDSITTISIGAQHHDINISSQGNNSVSMDFDEESAGISAAAYNLIGLILMGVIIGINVPFKIYIKRKRKNKEISNKLATYCRKHLFRMPWYNSGALLLALLVRNTDNVFKNTESLSKTEHDLGINLMIISIISSLLIALFTFFWQQHSIHFHNLEHFFDKEELYKRQKKSFGIKMRGKFMLVQGITTLLPVSIIVFYIFMSMSKPADFGIINVSDEQADILLGGYSSLVHDVIKDKTIINEITSGSYINTVDMFFSGIGIFTGVIVTLIYIMFFVRWLTIQTANPIKSLLIKMEEATETKEYSFSMVRTRDELGQLTEGYNVMAEKIMNYIRKVEEINRGLEEKVKERTAEIAAQRDEIEAQRDEIEAQRDLVIEQKAHIEEIHKEVTDSINYATRLQTAILPDIEILKNTISEHFVLFKPKDKVSGDFYWWALVEKQLIISVADCTGHGVPGAFMSMLGSSLLREIVVKEAITDPRIILNRLREEIINTLKQKGNPSEQKDGMDMALVSINLKSLETQFAGANNPVYIVKNKSGELSAFDSQLSEIRGDYMPVAIYENMAPFTIHEILLKKGDCIYLKSDGFQDQFGGQNRKKFLSKNMKELIGSISHKPMHEQKEILNSTFENWKGEHDQIDDVTLIGIRI